MFLEMEEWQAGINENGSKIELKKYANSKICSPNSIFLKENPPQPKSC